MSLLESLLGFNNNFGIDKFNNKIINDFYRTYNYQLNIIDPITNTTNKFVPEWVSKVQFPLSQNPEEVINFMDAQIKIAGKYLVQQLNLEIRDTADGESFKYFKNWKDLIYNPATRNNNYINKTPSRYKRNAILLQFSPDYSQAKQFNLYHIWPLEQSLTSLSQDDNNITTFNIILHLDSYDSEIIKL